MRIPGMRISVSKQRCGEGKDHGGTRGDLKMWVMKDKLD